MGGFNARMVAKIPKGARFAEAVHQVVLQSRQRRLDGNDTSNIAVGLVPMEVVQSRLSPYCSESSPLLGSSASHRQRPSPARETKPTGGEKVSSVFSKAE